MMFVYDEQQQQYVQEAQEITNVPTQPPLNSPRFARRLITPPSAAFVNIIIQSQKNGIGGACAVNKQTNKPISVTSPETSPSTSQLISTFSSQPKSPQKSPQKSLKI